MANKPLCMTLHSEKVYIGDSRGLIFELTKPFTVPRQVAALSGPVSAITFVRELMYCATWDGTVYHDGKEVKIGTDPVKCIAAFGNRLFASVDRKLVVLDLNLGIIEQYETTNKIFCMDARADGVQFGLGTGLAAVYTTSYERECKSPHESTVLCMRNGVTGSTDGTVRINNEVIFKGGAWTRSVWDANLFSCGREVIVNKKPAYSHDDEVVGVVQCGKAIISIGLDFCYMIYHEGVSITEEEEIELMAMLNS